MTEEKEFITEGKKEKKENLKELQAGEESAKQEDKAEVVESAAEEARKEKQKEEKSGIAYIFGSQNNTMVHITDLAGNTLSRVTGGMITKHSRLKSSPTVAMFVAKKSAERAKDLGINALYVRTKSKTGGIGVGPGMHAAVRTLGKEGFRIISILDTTKVARGGPKKKGGKRGRRV